MRVVHGNTAKGWLERKNLPMTESHGEGHLSGAKQAAEKGLFRVEFGGMARGLKSLLSF
jgi:hypothetical protein